MVSFIKAAVGCLLFLSAYTHAAGVRVFQDGGDQAAPAADAAPADAAPAADEYAGAASDAAAPAPAADADADAEAPGLSEINLVGKSGQSAKLVLGTGSEVYSLGVTSKGQFFIRYKDADLVTMAQDSIIVHAKSLSAASVSSNELNVSGANQFKLLHLETFTGGSDTHKAGSEWGSDQTLQCGGVTLLKGGDVLARQELSKVFENLGPHTALRLVATYHFVDDWQGETGYAKVDGKYVYTEAHDQGSSVGKLNVCGSDAFPEGRFTVPIDVTIPHSDNTAKISFGSTINPDSNKDAFWGISSVSVYLV